jgi:hypothetical protein
MQKYSVALPIPLVVLILLLSGCGGNPDIQVNELSNSTMSYEESVHINNCGGKADSEQTKSRSFSTDIQGGIDIGVQQLVEGVISAKYSQSRNTSVSQRLVAPAGTNMEFVLKWSEEVHAGNVTVNGATGTYTVSIPIAVEQIASQDLGCSGSSQIIIPPTKSLQPTNFPNILPPPTSDSQQPIIQMDGPFRDHKIASVGTGVFAQVTFSDGNAPYSQDDLNTNHFQIYRIRLEENPDGCGVSIYNTNKVWFSSSANTVFTVNGQEVGKLSVSTGRHGFVADWSVKVGDKICAVGYAPSGFHIVFGPDMYYHYDSYCYRGNC